jgi:selenocysteine lyase/cysteine desulfurase
VYQLGAALAYLDKVGVERIERHTVALAHQLRDGLAALGFRLFTPPDNASSIVSFYLDRNQSRAREVLDKAGIQVSVRERGAQVRVSPALFNTRAEIGQFLEAAKALV